MSERKAKQGEDSQAEGTNKLMLREQLLPMVGPMLAVDHRRQFQETVQTATLSFGEAMERLKMIRGGLSREISPGDSFRAIRDLVVHKESVALAHVQDALEEARLKLGLNDERERLFNLIWERVSLEKGFEMFNKACRQVLGRCFSSLGELYNSFPHLSATELALLPFVKRVPQYFLTFGHNLEILNDPYGELDPNRAEVAPTLIGATVQGLAFAAADFDFAKDEIKETDPYRYAGVTGKRTDVEVVPFIDEVQRAFDRLIPLVYTNSRLHDRLWQEASGSALGIGFGRIAELAYLRCFGTRPKRDGQTLSFTSTINQLTGENRQRFEEMRQAVESNVYQAIVMDLGRDTLLRPDEVFSMIGLLTKLPEAFLQDELFRGYIQPYGPGVKIIDQQGELREFIPYNPFFLRQAVYNLYWEVVDVSRANSTFAGIFNQLLIQTEAKVLTETVESGGDLSELEGIKADLQLQYGVILEFLPKHKSSELRGSLQAMGAGVLLSEGRREQTNSRMSLDEAREVAQVVRLLPKELLRQVRLIKKVVATRVPLQAYLSGMHSEGEYVEQDKEIILYKTGTLLPSQIEAVYRLRRMFTLLHEVGESVWPMLSSQEQALWRSISWGGPVNDKASHFLTFYSHASGGRDDFCDHFAAYVFHGEEFRQKAALNEPLGQKYQFIRGVFERLTSQAKEYQQVSPLLLEEIHGELEQEVQRMDLAEAVQAREEEDERRWEESREKIAQVVKSHEEIEAGKRRKEELKEEDDLEPIERPFEEGVDLDEEQLLDGDSFSARIASVLDEFVQEGLVDRLVRRIERHLEEGEMAEVKRLLANHVDERDLVDVISQLTGLL